MGKDAVIQVVEQKLSIQLPQAEITHPNFPLEQLAGTMTPLLSHLQAEITHPNFPLEQRAGTMTPLLSHLQAVDHLPLSSALEGAQQIVAGEDFMSSNSFNQDRAVLTTASSLEESSSILPIAQSTDSAEPANTMLRPSSTATQMQLITCPIWHQKK